MNIQYISLIIFISYYGDHFSIMNEVRKYKTAKVMYGLRVIFTTKDLVYQHPERFYFAFL